MAGSESGSRSRLRWPRPPSCAASGRGLRSVCSWLVLILEAGPAVGVVLVERGALHRELGGNETVAALEHEGQRVVELLRLEVAVARLVEGFLVGPVRHHAVVQARATRLEASGLGV